MLTGKNWFHWGNQAEHPGDDKLQRWIPSPAGNVATGEGLRIVDAITSRMTQKQKRNAVDTALVPWHLRGGGSVAVCRSLEGRATPAHPAPLARGIANALPSLPSPPQGWRSREAKTSGLRQL